MVKERIAQASDATENLMGKAQDAAETAQQKVRRNRGRAERAVDESVEL
jgi:uncharacterized protein YjbJ (UPF0337 family)